MFMKIYIGIDDTDNLETRGTGHQARSLGFSLVNSGLFQLHSVTRHQLLVDRRIPFTSHNSSACLLGESLSGTESLISHCRDFLTRESAHDSDAGLCVGFEDSINRDIAEFGMKAKRDILTLENAETIARKNSIYLDGFLNTRLGMIGALAAVGLRKAGNDGRLLWLENLRNTTGIFKAGDFLNLTGTERAIDKNGVNLPADALVNITGWCRPVMKEGLITLIVEKIENSNLYEYQSATKDLIKRISE
jgi:hypothetical protein